MTVTHLDAKRIRGDNSIVYRDTFGKDSWVSTDSANASIEAGYMNMIVKRDSSNDMVQFDLQTLVAGTNASDTAWVLRFEIKIGTLTSTDSGYLFIGLGSDLGAAAASDQNSDRITVQFKLNLTSGETKIYTSDSDNGTISATSGDANASYNLVKGTRYFVELRRKTATTYDAFVRSDSHSGTVRMTATGTCASTTNNLRYITVQNSVSSGSPNIGCQIYDMSFYNGIAAIIDEKATLSNVLEGTMFEAIDEGAYYWYSGGEWKPPLSTKLLKAYYKFNVTSGTIPNLASSNASSGHSADMTTSGVSYDSSGKIGRSISSDGSNDYALAGSSVGDWGYMTQNGAQWTLCVWLKINTDLATNEPNIIDMIQGGDVNSVGVALSCATSYAMNFKVAANQSNGMLINATTTTSYLQTDNNWHFYVVRYNGKLVTDCCTINRDGASNQEEFDRNTVNVSGGTGSSASSVPNIFRRNTNAGFAHINGIDEMSWWNRLLSDDEINILYNSGSGKEI